MSEDRLILAIGRLERALSRVEAAAARPAEQSRGDESEAALQSLSERHDKLKRQVESAIGALDQLIAKG
ncbi:hypothetical protein [Sphingomonas cavernae]|uniref:Uncharacterized protein n=1 Tax=Sphingomonas cavernae TaxID=2320861 RepID=A0A418W5M8_9SPHN|nr:hypothetical protein [Sphingomonas cavernae]RJF85351.1 hypothetical protein D3876_15480 [Sphingomonas cavernae]